MPGHLNDEAEPADPMPGHLNDEAEPADPRERKSFRMLFTI